MAQKEAEDEIRLCKATILFCMSVFDDSLPVFPVTDALIDSFDFSKLFEGFLLANSKQEFELPKAVLKGCFDTKE